MNMVKEKVRINDTEFEITLTPAENDPMVLDAPLPTPDGVLGRVPSIEQLPRWEDGAPIPENRRAIENRRQEEIAREAGIWGMVVPCADQPHAVKLCLRGDLIRIEWSPCNDLFGALGLMAPCHQWVRENQLKVARELLARAVNTSDIPTNLADWFVRRRDVVAYGDLYASEHFALLARRLGRWDLIAEMWGSPRPACWGVEKLKDLSFDELRSLVRALRERGVSLESYVLRRLAKETYYREFKGEALLRYLGRL